MTGGQLITADAQWALHGRTPDREGYRVLACSTGELAARNFEEAIGRFSPGTPGPLPQVWASYLTTAFMSAGSYLALAIHKHTGEDTGADGRRVRYDPAGQGFAYTSYFCVPYAPLARAAITYQALYQALDPIRLPRESGPPIPIELTTRTTLTLAVDELAMQAAALLLTTRPVCVTGATDTTLAQRLAFIDTVMSLLPYGLRARMTAATWTRPTHRDHRFRLFFSDVARAADPPDNVLVWGQPEERSVTPADDYVYEYLTWLRETVGQPLARLTGMAGMTDAVRFRHDEFLHVLDEIGINDADDPGPGRSATEPDLVPPPGSAKGPSEGQSAGELLLRKCARHVRAGDQARVRSDIARLKAMADVPVDDDQRARYRQILTETGLLRHYEKLGGSADRLYGLLLRMAFTVPLGYEGYCQVEDCLGNTDGTPPHEALLQAIDRCGLSDQVATAVVYWQLGVSHETRLDKWYASGQVNAVQLIHLLARDWARPRHARAACDVTIDYLARMQRHTGPNDIRKALAQHGFLGQALRDNRVGPEQYQVSALSRFLKAAYPTGLDRRAILQILAGGTVPPTPPLLAAVLLQLPREGDAHLARDAYAHGVITGMDLAPETGDRLSQHLPAFDVVSRAGPTLAPGAGPAPDAVAEDGSKSRFVRDDGF